MALRNVQETSVEAYHQHWDSGVLGEQQHRVFIVLKYAEQPMTNREIAKCLGIEPSTVSARRNELIEAGIVEAAGKRRCRVTGKRALQWRIR